MISDFVKTPDARTADIVPSIRVLIAQLYTFMTIENFQELYLKETDLTLNQETLQVFFRYAFEEQLRRNQKEDLEPPSKTVILKLLYPSYAARVNEVISEREASIRAEYETGKSDDGMQRYFDMAMMFKSLDKDVQISKSLMVASTDEEEKKVEEDPKQTKKQLAQTGTEQKATIVEIVD